MINDFIRFWTILNGDDAILLSYKYNIFLLVITVFYFTIYGYIL